MASYRVGSAGPDVARIQKRLQALGFYRGPLDGLYGGGTDAAVRAFQQSEGLSTDGIVGPETWKALFARGAPAAPALLDQSLDVRCLALTGSFETGSPVPECFAGLSGDFDGQGLSFGALQWNLGQGSLQPLLEEMARTQPDAFAEVFNTNAPVLQAVLRADRDEQLDWARSIQDPIRHQLDEPWRGQFKSLGRREEFQRIEQKGAASMYREALAWRKEYGLKSPRATALLFDIRVQNGSIRDHTKAQIARDFAALPAGLSPQGREVACLRIVANRRAEAAKPEWVEDVRRRKLTIAEGEGTVHGRHYDLEEEYGIGLR